MADGKKLFDFFELFRQGNGRFITKVDHLDDFTVITGLAARGTLDSSASWLLERKKVIGGVIVEIEYADNANFTQVWNDRLLSFTGGNGTGGAENLFMLPIRLHDEDGQPYSVANPVPTTGSFTFSGLSTDLLVTRQTITDTAAKLPASPLTARNSMIIENKDPANSIFIGDTAGVTASGAGEGWEIPANSYYSIDITDAIELYAICDTGLSAVAKTLELA